MLSDSQRRAAFALIRAAIDARLRGAPPPPLPAGGELDEPRGAFVTLRLAGDLRGCIGFTQPQATLARALRDLAARAAFDDPRFPPVSAEEAPRLELEVSVLSPLSPANPQAIEIGRHGLRVSCGARAGLLLPQVAASRGWDAETFLRQTCLKAGLPPEAWERPQAEVRWFSCDVYEE